jgi:hypothetical protein
MEMAAKHHLACSLAGGRKPKDIAPKSFEHFRRKKGSVFQALHEDKVNLEATFSWSILCNFWTFGFFYAMCILMMTWKTTTLGSLQEILRGNGMQITITRPRRL